MNFNDEDLQDLIDFLCEKLKKSSPKNIDKKVKLIKILKITQYLNSNKEELSIIDNTYLFNKFIKPEL